MSRSSNSLKMSYFLGLFCYEMKKVSELTTKEIQPKYREFTFKNLEL